MVLVLGLGNPGRRYDATRHNAGFRVVDRLAERRSLSFDKNQFGALVTSTDRMILAKPQGYMNLSGQAAASLRGFYKVADSDIVVVHDEVDLPFGEVRVKIGGGTAGHNGVKDVAEKLGTRDFVRVRFGVGRPPEGWETADYVLSPFTGEETAEVPALVDRAADAVEHIVTDGVERAMQTVNTRQKRADPPLL
jgi:PTH1 family peptidyl-tRNA hydrolase